MVLGLARDAAAIAAPPAVAVMRFRGTGEEVAERAILSALPSGVRIIGRNQVDRALARLSGDGALRSDDEYARLARLVRADAIVEGRVDVAGAEVALGLTVRGADGKTAGTTAFRGRTYKALVAVLEKRGPPTLARMLARTDESPLGLVAQLAPEPERSGLSASEPAGALADAAAEGDAPDDRPPYLEVAAGPRFMTRTLVFTDNLSGVPGYTMTGSAAVSVRVEYYPVARKNSAARNIGFAAEWDRSVAARTVAVGGRSLAGTSIGSYRIGGRYRLTSGSVYATLGADYGRHGFILEVDNVFSPNVEYTFLRPVVMASAPIARGWSFGLSLAYIHVLAVGGLGDDDMFPRMNANGVDMRASFGYRFNPRFGMEIGADLRHYAYRMNVRPGDRYVVGGAMDEHFGGSVLATYRMD